MIIKASGFLKNCFGLGRFKTQLKKSLSSSFELFEFIFVCLKPIQTDHYSLNRPESMPTPSLSQEASKMLVSYELGISAAWSFK